MTHPILTSDAKDVRDRMRAFFHDHAYSIRNSNIVFVCGGKNDGDMRARFREYAKNELKEYKIFFPEFSFKNLFLLDDTGTHCIDLNKFEENVADLSCCVLVFPEAPGSLVELGLFSAHKKIAKRLLVVTDVEHDDGKDSFITLGPLNKINELSDFKPMLVDDYKSPNFSKIKNRITERHKVPSKHTKIGFSQKEWIDLQYFEKFTVVHWIVDVCRLSSVDTVIFIAKSLFGNTVKKEEIRELCSILIGSGEFALHGEEKWIRLDDSFTPIITTKSGEEVLLLELKFEIGELYLKDSHFDGLIREAYS